MNAAAPARPRYSFMNFLQQRMQRTCDFYLALRQELMNTRNQAMAETGLNYLPVAPAISPVLPDDQSARPTPSGAPPTGCESTVSALWS
jgi:hypothetical protein